MVSASAVARKSFATPLNPSFSACSANMRYLRSSDLDETTRRQLTYGQGLMQLLRQPQYHPMAQHEQVITLICAMAHLLQDVPPAQVPACNRALLERIRVQAAELCRDIDRSGRLEPADRERILAIARDFLSEWRPSGSVKQHAQQ